MQQQETHHIALIVAAAAVAAGNSSGSWQQAAGSAEVNTSTNQQWQVSGTAEDLDSADSPPSATVAAGGAAVVRQIQQAVFSGSGYGFVTMGLVWLCDLLMITIHACTRHRPVLRLKPTGASSPKLLPLMCWTDGQVAQAGPTTSYAGLEFKPQAASYLFCTVDKGSSLQAVKVVKLLLWQAGGDACVLQ